MGIQVIIKKIISDFFIITTLILIGVIVYSMIYNPEATFDIQILQAIVFSGFITSLPTLIFYSKKELSKKQMLIRQLIHFMILEGMILWSAYANHSIQPGDVIQGIFTFGMVFVIYFSVRLKGWFFDKKEAEKLNKSLEEYNKL